MPLPHPRQQMNRLPDSPRRAQSHAWSQPGAHRDAWKHTRLHACTRSHTWPLGPCRDLHTLIQSHTYSRQWLYTLVYSRKAEDEARSKIEAREGNSRVQGLESSRAPGGRPLLRGQLVSGFPPSSSLSASRWGFWSSQATAESLQTSIAAPRPQT